MRTPPSRLWHSTQAREVHTDLTPGGISPCPASGPGEYGGPLTLTTGLGRKGDPVLGKVGVCKGRCSYSHLSDKQTQPCRPTKSHRWGILLSAKPSRYQTMAEAVGSIDGIQWPGPNSRREASTQTSGEEPRDRTQPAWVKRVSRTCHPGPRLCRLGGCELGLQPKPAHYASGHIQGRERKAWPHCSWPQKQLGQPC